MSLARARALLPAALSFSFAAVAGAQYTTHVQKPADKPTLRATAVLEWTGDLAKPSAARLIPIAVWDGEHYQPAGLYLAQPAPLALLTGTQYELEKAGQPAGFFNVRGAATLGSGSWIGVGKYQPVPPPPPPPKLKVAKRLPAPTLTTGAKGTATTTAASTGSGDSSDRPTLHRKADDTPAGSTPASPPAAPSSTPPNSTPTTAPETDPDKPTLHRRSDPDSTDATKPSSDSAPSTTTGSAPASDPDKPTLHRKEDPDTGSTPSADDPDRPTLHRRSDTPDTPPDVDPDRPTLHKTPAAEARGTDVGSEPGAVSGGTAIDPDRPTLRRGKADALDTALVPTKFEGSTLPIRQMVAVSDVKDVHSGDPDAYLYHWSSAEDEAKMRSAMEALAVKALNAASAAAQAATFGPASRTAAATAARSRKSVAKTGAQPSPAALNDEVFASYELSFSSGPTVVLSARGGPAGDRYVTLVAQPDFYGQPRVLFRQVSSAATLDQTPRMQLVDAVDTDDDKQAELIFELIGAPGSRAIAGGAVVVAPEREYAIYRVTAAGAEQVFSTGPLP